MAAALMAAVLMLASCSASNKGEIDADDNLMMDTGSPESGTSLPSYNEKGEMAEGADDAIKDETDNGTGETPEFAPKIIKTATLRAETQNFTDAISEIEASVKSLGGYIESCNIQNMNHSYRGNNSSSRYADYVLRIPADKLDAFLTETGELLNVTSSNSNAEDISGKYYDIQARISVLETERQLVEKMLSEATSINTMITLEERLYDIIYEIESYKTAIKVYDSKVAYSTVNLSIREVVDLTPLEVDDSFGARFLKAVKESWNSTVEFCQGAVIFLVYAAPFLVVVAIGAAAVVAVALIIVAIVKRRIRKAKARKNEA